MKKLKALFYWGIRLGMKITGFSEQFVLFLVMGGVNTLFYYSLYSFLIYIGVFYAAAVVIGTVCGVLFNFQTFGRVVFKNFQMRLLGRFFTVYAVVCLANIAGLKLLEFVGLTNKYTAGAVLVLPVALLGYVLNKTFVFSGKESESGNLQIPTGESD
ncbi:MAG: GtrA family protein [Alphaproteobacteria bacterium]|nr:GtrA family protein [Alphaproteobacteria bacterium]